MRKWLIAFIIGVMQGFRIPISIFPFWPKVRTGRSHYRPFYQPWRNDDYFWKFWAEETSQSVTLTETSYLLFSLSALSRSHSGEIWECGVYKGATARLLAAARDRYPTSGSARAIRLFDTFEGMPERRPDVDSYKLGSFSSTSLEAVKAKLAPFDNVHFYPGMIPQTFAGLEDNAAISFAHIDVDQFETTKVCCEFIYPRLLLGGIILIDDYGRPATIGARYGADEFFNKLNISPVVLHTGQALIIKQ